MVEQDRAAATARPKGPWRTWLAVVAAALVAWISLQLFPKAHPLALLHSKRDYEGILFKLSDAGSSSPLSNPLSDRALFADWLMEPEGAGGHLLTVGSAIDYERRQVRLQQAGLAQELQRRRDYALQQAAETARIQQVDAARGQAEAAALNRQHALAEAQTAAAGAAQARTAACNTARSHAYATAASAAAFIAWVRAHPCPEGTDIGDGYWNVAR